MIVPEQIAEPIHRGPRAADGRSGWLDRSLNHDNRKAEAPRGGDFCVRRCAARVLGDDDIDGLRLQKFALRLDIERAAMQEQPAARRQRVRRGRLDTAHEVVMLRGGTERSHVLPTDGEEHALCTQAKLGNSGIDVRHTHPAVSVGELPWVTPQDEQGQLAPLGGGTSVGGDPRGKRMRGVDDGPNVLGIQPVCQAFGAPEAAYATGNGELRGSRYPPRQGQRRRKALVAGAESRQLASFSRAAEDEDAHDCL